MQSRFDVSVAAPCSESWNRMRGSGRARHCSVCEKVVHDLALMTESQVEVLAMQAAAGVPVCARITRRAEGGLALKSDPEPLGRSNVGTVLLSAALATGIPAAAQNSSMIRETEAGTAHRSTEPVRVASGDDSQAVVTGRLLKPDGTPVNVGLVYVGAQLFVVDDRGRFELHTAPGTYEFVVQTGPAEAEHMAAVILHEGDQSFGDVRTADGRGDLVLGISYTTMGTMSSTLRWPWRSRVRHPVLYLRSVARKM